MEIDKKTRRTVIVVAVFLVVLMIGQSIVYVNNPYHCDAEVSRNGSTVEVTVDTNHSLGYTVNSLRTDSMRGVESYAVYFDEKYPVVGDQTVIKDCIDRLRLNFSNDNTELTVVDTAYIADMMATKNTKTALIFMTGTLPEDIYDGTPSSPIFQWLKIGGVMYWLNEKIGHTYSTSSGKVVGVEDSDGLFFGNSDVVNPSIEQVFTKNLADGSLTYKLGIYYGETTNGLDCSKLVGPYVALDYNDGQYSAVTVLRYAGGSGIIGVFGGQLKYEAVPTSAMASVAQTIISKLSYDTESVDYRTASGSGTIEMDCGDGYSYVYIYFDRVNAIWAKMIEVPGR